MYFMFHEERLAVQEFQRVLLECNRVCTTISQIVAKLSIDQIIDITLLFLAKMGYIMLFHYWPETTENRRTGFQKYTYSRMVLSTRAREKSQFKIKVVNYRMVKIISILKMDTIINVALIHQYMVMKGNSTPNPLP